MVFPLAYLVDLPLASFVAPEVGLAVRMRVGYLVDLPLADLATFVTVDLFGSKWEQRIG